MSQYDVIIIGGGSPGEHCAGALAAGGLHVAVVERELVGGECSYWACIPSKTLLRPGEAAQGANDAAGTATVDVGAALAWRDFMVADYSDAGQQQWLTRNRITLIRGRGRLAGPGTVEVDGVRYAAQHIVIATGSEPIIPPVPGLRDLGGLWTNREATGLTAVPRHLLVLGGGAVGVEMAQAIHRLGARVTLVASGARVLPREPQRLGEALGEELTRDGIELMFGVRATAAGFDTGEYWLQLDDGRRVSGDRLLVATGRQPRIADIGLETVGIRTEGRGIPVDSRLRAGERLWAIGDVTGQWLLTHVGKYQGRIVAANILGESREATYEAVPRVVFTDPQAAAVGALDAPFAATIRLAEVAKMAAYSRSYDKSSAFLTLLSDGERLTGAYALGPEAGEWLQQATLAIRARVPLSTLVDVIQPFPTFSEAYLEAMRRLMQQIATANQAIRFDDAAAYERYMGKWSQLVGDIFLTWLDAKPGGRWLDVGCGNGAFSEMLAARCAPAQLRGIDPSEPQLVYARERPALRDARFVQADAMALPFPDDSFDAAVMPLVIFFVPDPARGVAEMARVVRPGGTVCAYAWDMEGGGFPYEQVRSEMQAVGLVVPTPPSPEASRLEALATLWTDAGLEAVETRAISVQRTFADFDDFWQTVLGGPSVGGRLATASPDAVAIVKTRLEERLSKDAAGRIVCSARANAVRGRVPG